MPATKPKTKSTAPRPVKRSPSVKTPRFNIPGRLSDEVFEKVEHTLRTMTPEEFRQNLIEALLNPGRRVPVSELRRKQA